MNKHFLLGLLLVFSGTRALAQTTATDFTASDCEGITHHLFAELDAGKVIVIAWVMPCAACLPPSLAAFNAVKDYTDDYPGQVLFYLVDDFGNTNCQTLKSWAGANGLPKSNVFSTNAINMSDYGDYGMPKVVVLGGGANHLIFYNQNNTTANVGAAIETALGFTAVSEPRIDLGITLFPNPARDGLSVSYQLPKATEWNASVLDLTGKELFSVAKDVYQPDGAHDMQIDISGLSNGVYLFRMNTENGSQVVRFFVSK